MFLDYIEITNFRPYYGTQKIDFGFNETENLTVILADNGSGKTSLVNALTWCLYGEELHDVRDKSEPLYNLSAARDAEQEEGDVAEVNVEVKIRFYYFDEDEDGNITKKYFIIDRKQLFQKWGVADWESSFDDYLIVEETGKELMEDDSAQYSINNKIPENMFQYFFFNGATLSNYFKNDSDLNLRTSVEEISQIELINKVSDHLEKTYTDINDRFDKKKPKGKVNYNKLIEDKLIAQKELEDKRDKNYEQIDIANENVINYRNKLDKIDSEYIKELNTKRDTLNRQLKNINSSLKEDSKDYESLVLELFPIATLFDELVSALKLADEAKEKKTAPPEIERDLLNDILEDGVCICGTRLDEHPECIEELKSRLKNTSKMKKDNFYKDYYEIKDALKRLKDLPKIESIKKSIETNKSNKISLELELSKISEEISTSDEDEVAKYEEQLQKNKERMEELRNKNTSLTSDIDRLSREIEKLEDQRNKEESLKGELKELNDKILFCEEAVKIVSSLQSNVKEHIRTKINNRTREQFTEIKWANNKYTDVTIEQDYTIKITKSSGQKVRPGDLSDGEENLLALSFMMALHSLSGFEIPLIIDAPLEKLDKSKRIDFISGLHEYTKDKQIVFLFTDSQYTDDVRANMLKNIVDEYELKPYPNKTEIVKHG